MPRGAFIFIFIFLTTQCFINPWKGRRPKAGKLYKAQRLEWFVDKNESAVSSLLQHAPGFAGF